MKKLLMAALLLPIMAMAQIRYERGYFVDNHGKRTDCLIKNRSWGNNPEKFDYKTSEDAAEQTAVMADVSEFSVEGKSKYVKATVPMERSSVHIGNLPRNAAYTLKPETHFFKSLFEASHSLYIYEENGLVKFFDRNPSGEMKQLVYIEYVDKGQLRRYNHYYTQLLEDFSCPDANLESYSKLKYQQSSLLEYYKKTADCKSENVTVSEVTKTKFNLRPFIGFKSMKLTAGGNTTSQPEVETSKSGLAYGLEAELVFASRGYKWGMFLDLDYQKLEDDIDLPDGNSINDYAAKVRYADWQLTLGGRHYFYLSDKSKIFVNAAFVTNLIKDQVTVDYKQNSYTGDLFAERFGYNFALGAGMSFGKFNAEVRYYTPQNLFKFTDGKFSKFMATVSYSIF